LIDSTASEKELWSRLGFIVNAPATWFLVAVNIAVFSWIRKYSAPAAAPHTLSHYGANWGFQTLSGQWWRLLTSLFIHTERAHLLLNMVGLVLFGRHAEKIIGTRRFALVYFGSGFAGGICLVAFRPEASGYGASLCILGLLGSLIGFYSPRVDVLSSNARWKLAALIAIAVISLWDDVSVIQDGNPGHIIGLLTGLILGIVFGMPDGDKRHVYAISAILAVALVASAVIARQHNPLAPHLYAAADAFDDGNNDIAVREIGAALRIAPDNLSANRVASEIFFNEPDLPRAEKAIRNVLSANPEDDYFLYLLALVELRTNRCDEATVIRQKLNELKSRYSAMLLQAPCALNY